MSRQQLLVLAVMLLKQVQQRRTFVLKFVLSVILSTPESRNSLTQADVLTDSRSVSISKSNFIFQTTKAAQRAALFSF